MFVSEDWNGSLGSADLASANDVGTEVSSFQDSNIFCLERVQLQFPVALRHMDVEKNILVMALTCDKLLLIDLDRPEEITDIDIPKKILAFGTTHKVFTSNTTHIMFVSTTFGDNCLVFPNHQVRILAKLKGMTFESALFLESSASTFELLLLATNGQISLLQVNVSDAQLKHIERSFTILQQLDGSEKPLLLQLYKQTLFIFTSRHIYRLNSENSDSLASFFSTDVNDRKPFFTVQRGEEFREIRFSPFPEAAYEKLYVCILTNKRIMKASIDDLLTETFSFSAVLELPTDSEKPVQRSVLISSFHIIYLEGDVLFAFNILNNQLVFKQTVPLLQRERILGLTEDREQRTFWIYTTEGIHEITITNEARDVARILFEQKDYERALTAAAESSPMRNLILIEYGEEMMKRGECERAAMLYADSSKSVEQVAVELLDHEQYDALRKYLWKKLRMTKKAMSVKRTLLVNWILELILSRFNKLDDEKQLTDDVSVFREKEKQLDVEFAKLLREYKDDLDKGAAYSITVNYGREEQLLQLATVMDDRSYIMSYWIQRENYEKALQTLQDGVDEETLVHHANALLTNRPSETVGIWKQQPNLNVHALIPALLSYNQKAGVPVEANAAIHYLHYVIDVLGCSDPTVHNTLFCMYAYQSRGNEEYLLKYIEKQGNNPLYDMDLGLRLCLQYECKKSAIKILVLLQLYSQAVDMALEEQDSDTAMNIASIPSDDKFLQKRLWRKIAQQLLAGHADVKTAVRTLSQSNVLSLSEILNMLPTDVDMDDIREHVCAELNNYRSAMEASTRDMEESDRITKALSRSFDERKKEVVQLDATQGCLHCNELLILKPFVVFPCKHAFHHACMIAHAPSTHVTDESVLDECQVCGPNATYKLIDEPFHDDF
ncbi:ubiquitin-protein ligase E3 [Schizosaccharomyces japonicus yFS275]|uniref:Ubiquitin-protein ligase E3 n=1 Tax=Schizosaccharomyces japonicus (strain yFS275 / FY16936) TaxID=402676 RepID=B6K323_SCHJY|nr:ubiquitin-protein ligase E3 [Schizosaccharomyces japonicus yFS275]EEB07880.1 ubiquitin-protein ligase E3 [Schizosaccharomyces japonicus yFS275]